MDCEHGMGDPAWCVLCNGRARREAKQDALEAEMREEAQMIARIIARKERDKRLREEAKAVREWTSGNAIDGRLIVR